MFYFCFLKTDVSSKKASQHLPQEFADLLHLKYFDPLECVQMNVDRDFTFQFVWKIKIDHFITHWMLFMLQTLFTEGQWLSIQLAEPTLPTPEVRGSNPVFSKFYLYCQLHWNDENKENRGHEWTKLKT